MSHSPATMEHTFDWPGAALTAPAVADTSRGDDMSYATCSVDGCENPHQARGWCPSHYNRWRRYGDPLARTETVQRKCSIDGCERDYSARDLCRLHYERWRTTGSTDFPGRTTEDRFWPRVDKSGDCWIWTAGMSGTGYGSFWFSPERGVIGAHIYSYELAVGPVPEGLELDHLCRNRACVNPDHLEAVTHFVNCYRGEAPKMMLHRNKRCMRNHAMTEQNTYVSPSGRRDCRKCMALREQWRREREKSNG